MKRLVCLHGFTGAPESWDAVLAELPPDVETLCPGIVGHDPDIPRTGSHFEDEVDRLAATLASTDGPYHLAGYSLGARLALGLLVCHRQLFCSATLIGVHPGLGSERERQERAIADDELAHRLERDGVERFVDFWQSLPLFNSQSTLPPEVLHAQRQRRLDHASEGLAYALRALSLGRMPDYRSRLPKLDVPVLLMAGAEDLKFSRLAEAMSVLLPSSTFETVPAAGHNLLLEAPPEVAASLLSSMHTVGPGSDR